MSSPMPGDLDVRRRLHAEFPGKIGFNQVYVGAGIEEKPPGSLAIHIDAVRHRTAFFDMQFHSPESRYRRYKRCRKVS